MTSTKQSPRLARRLRKETSQARWMLTAHHRNTRQAWAKHGPGPLAKAGMDQAFSPFIATVFARTSQSAPSTWRDALNRWYIPVNSAQCR